jgi:bis(5'-nucleosidyl)-tetraphosphatase
MTPFYEPIDAHAAGLLLRRRCADGWRWLLLCGAGHREWGFPKGHLNRGEGFVAAALRECAEECGIGLVALDGDEHELHYVLPTGRRKCVVYFGAVTSVESVSLSHEHRDAAWLNAKEVEGRLNHPNLRALFRAHLIHVIP